jgi:hypothetical protein
VQGKQGQGEDLVKFSFMGSTTHVRALVASWVRPGRDRGAGHKGSAVLGAGLQEGSVAVMHGRGSVDRRRAARGPGRALQFLVAGLDRVGKSDGPHGGGAGATG